MNTLQTLTKTPLRFVEGAHKKLARAGLKPGTCYYKETLREMLSSRLGVRRTIYKVTDSRSYGTCAKGNDRLARPFIERVEFNRGFPLLKKLGKDRPGEMVTFEMECFVPQGTREKIKTMLPLACECVGDGSLRSESSKKTIGMEGVEIRVPCSVMNYHRLYKVGAILASVGAKVNTSCGLHVHFDVRDLSPGKSWRDVKANGGRLYDVIFHVLRYLVPPSRMGNTYCALTPPSINDRYRAVNAEATKKHGTIEVRLAAGTVEPDKARLWAEVCLFFLRQPLSKVSKATLATVTKASEALDWIMRSDLPPTLKWWAAQRIEKFHPHALDKPADGANASEGSE